MTLSKQVMAICKHAQRTGDCGARCRLFEKCVVKNPESKEVNLLFWVKEINGYAAQMD